MLVDRIFDETPGSLKQEEASQEDHSIYAELSELTKYVEMMTKTLRDLETPVASTSEQLPQATQHLGDLAKLTEDGTHQVLALTEEIAVNRGQLHKSLVALKERLDGERARQVANLLDILRADESHLMKIHVALSFQDLVAQRIAKLVTILNEVQHKLLKLVVVFGLQQKAQGGTQHAEGRAYEMLRQLEASKTSGLEQHLVDEILSEFGVV